MESLARLVPFVWQQRGRLCVSFTLAALIAVLWAGALLLVFPAVEVLLAGRSMPEYIASKLATAQATVQKQSERREKIESLLVKLRTSGTPEEIFRAEKDCRDCISDLNEGLRQEWRFQWLQSNLVPRLNPDRFTLLAQLMSLLLILTAVKCCLSYIQETLVCASVERTMQSLRERLFRATLKLDHQTLALETTPTLMSRFTFDLQQLSNGLTLLGSKAVIEPLKAIVCVACAFGVNWRLTALSFACAPLAIVLFGQLGKRLKRASRRQMESMSRVYRALLEPLQSFTTVLAYRNERLHRRRLARENRDYFDKAMKIVRIDALSSPSIEFLAMIGVFVGSLPGAYLVLRGQTSIWGVQLSEYQMGPAELAVLYTMLAGILDPARRIASIYSKVKKSATACDRVFGWMDRNSLVTCQPEPVPMPRHHQSIEFDRVSFRYAVTGDDAQNSIALNDVSLKVPFGATVAIVGGNGSGKSTLANLLPRLYDTHAGCVRIDGVDVAQADPRELRRQIAVVTQDTQLFDMSIEDNIRYGHPGASPDEIEEAARRAHVLSFVQQLPDGVKTSVGDRGHRLSGGQRQRVALARAIVRDPAILILDEATSAVDVQSEQLIFESLADLARGRTTFIVTHAMTPVLLEQVTHVLVMEQGRAIAFGPHSAVLATCPAYQRLYDAQVRRRAA
ncbi:MAG: ABC transporter ATP-binding protein [Planctomycetota bacterium]